MPESKREKEIFEAALDLQSPEERAGYREQVCPRSKNFHFFWPKPSENVAL